jgi:hypothetical protein
MDFPSEILVTIEADETDPGDPTHEFLVVVESIEDAGEAGERVRVARYKLVDEGVVEAPPTYIPGPARP